MQINRLFEIVYILLDKETVTSKELARRFEVSTRTIFRDVETLSAVGIPIYMKKGRGGGISLLPNYILNKAVITNDEKDEIVSSLKALKTIDFSSKADTLSKLDSLFGESDTDWIEVDFSTWSNATNEAEVFHLLKEAILKKQVIGFSYASAKKQTISREVEPLKLCFKGGAWYLYGYCRLREDNRFFKLRRVRDLKVKPEHFKRKTPSQIFSKQEVFEEEFVTLVLKLSKKMAYRVFDEFEEYEEQSDGSYLVKIKYPKGEWIFQYIISFGHYCEVIEPKFIRQEIQKEFKKIMQLYT
ncbi:YafY family protein [Vallitaleaceae bacterium 9-2]